MPPIPNRRGANGHGNPLANIAFDPADLFRRGPVGNVDSQILDLIANTVTSRRQLIDKLLDPRRDIDVECGYPENSELNAAIYRLLFDREPIGTRVVEILPMESWVLPPNLIEDDDPDVTTPFEERWDEVGKMIRGESWHEDTEEHPLWEYLQRADILSGIGHFGGILLGIDDGAELSEPVEGIDERGMSVGGDRTAAMKNLIYIRCFDETLLEVTQWEEDITNPRFGQPKVYNITLNDPANHTAGGIGLKIQTLNVHWSRVVHVADNLTSSETLGVPRLRPVYNRVYDLRKLYGGSAEMYWRGAFPGLALETHPQLGSSVKIKKTELRAELQDYMNGLQRYLALTGMSAKSLAPQVVNPADHIGVQIDAICIKLGIPKRIFMGSERGELASSQDEGTWNGRLMNRQTGYLTPRLIVPFVDRLIAIGVLPAPGEEGYKVKWPDRDALTEEEQAKIALMRTDAMMKYVQGDVEMLADPLSFLVKILGLDEGAAEAMVDTALQRVEDEETFGDAGGDEDEVTIPPTEGETDEEIEGGGENPVPEV